MLQNEFDKARQLLDAEEDRQRNEIVRASIPRYLWEQVDNEARLRDEATVATLERMIRTYLALREMRKMLREQQGSGYVDNMVGMF